MRVIISSTLSSLNPLTFWNSKFLDIIRFVSSRSFARPPETSPSSEVLWFQVIVGDLFERSFGSPLRLLGRLLRRLLTLELFILQRRAG